GFQPSLSNSFPVLSYSSHTGTFGNIVGCRIGNGLFFDVLYENTRVLLVAKDGAPHFDSSKADLANHQFHFRFTTANIGQAYVIEASTNLTNWIPLSTNTAPNCVLDFVDPNTGSFPRRFFRAVLLP